MSILKKFASDAAVYGIAFILPRIINYVVITVYLTNKYGQTEFGVYSKLYTWIAIIIALLTFRMDTAYFRFASKEKNSNTVFSTATWVVAFLALLVSSILFFNPNILAHYVETSLNIDAIIQVSCLVILLDCLESIPFAKLRQEGKPKKFALIKIIKVSAIVLFTFSFYELSSFWYSITSNDIFLSTSVEDRIMLVVFANLIGSFVSFFCVLPYYIKYLRQPDFSLLTKMLAYSAPLAIVSVCGIFNEYFGINLVDYFSSNENGIQESGQFSAILRVAILMQLFFTAFQYAGEPFFFQNADRKDAFFLYARVANVFMFLASLLLILILVNVDIIKFFIGKDFHSGFGILPILLLSKLLVGLYYNISIWYKLTDKTYFGAIISFIGSVVFVFSSYQLIPILGKEGAAIASLCCYAVMLIICYFLGQKYYKVPYPISKISYKIVLALVLGWWFKIGFIDAYFDNIWSRLLLGNMIAVLFIGMILRSEPQILGRIPFFKPKTPNL